MSTSLLRRLNFGLDDATGIAGKVRTGRRSAVDVLAQARARAESAAGKTANAFITEDWDRAAEAAAALDKRGAAREELGPLAGVPLSVKDVIAVAGLPVTAASLAFADRIATTTAPAVQRLLDADAILIGKTNCPEFAFGPSCDSHLGGRTTNPRFPSATPGGSSGGEAASLAAGISALGIGSDYGGSLRWPAQCVGIAALRPGLGSLPVEGQVPGADGSFGDDGIIPATGSGVQGTFQTIGPMARSVRDLRTAFQIMRDQSDTPTAEPPQSVGYDGARARPGNRPMRLLWTDGSRFGRVRREVRVMMEQVAAKLLADGSAIREEPEALSGCLPAYDRLRAVDPMQEHAAAIRGREHRICPSNLHAVRSTFLSSPAEVRHAWRAAEAARRAAQEELAAVDALILPVAGGPAADTDGLLDVDGTSAQGWEIMGHCRAVTLTGCPVVSIPVAMSSDGLPLSIQIVTGPGLELHALDIAEQLELLLV
ncbi:amidase [Arthrobacter sp. NPDC058192]|uniref:amidase n=1 Tax=Arthrobacter sp. NPDC058192 TaxID=3346372 RepID=UPI0036EC2D5E